MAICDKRANAFRYPRTTLVVLGWLLPLPMLVGPAVYFLSSPRPAGGDLAGWVAFEVAVALAFYGAYRACATYLVEVSPDAIRVNGLFHQREFRFSSLGKVALLESGGRGPGYVLALYDQKGRQICKISNDVEQFEEMVALVKEHAFAVGTPYRYRDMWGSWTTRRERLITARVKRHVRNSRQHPVSMSPREEICADSP